MNKYYRLCNGLSDQGKLISIEKSVFSLIDGEKDFYQSAFLYNEDHFKQFTEVGSIRDIKDVEGSRLIFDFDSQTDLEKARKDTIVVLDRLIKDGGITPENPVITFSGNKGFGLEVIIDPKTPDQMKEIALKFAGDLETFDTSIYNASRVIRIPSTKHQKTGLFKTVINIDELNTNSIDEIKKTASQRYKYEENQEKVIFKNIPDYRTKKKEKIVEKSPDQVDFLKKPTWMSNWKYSLIKGHFPAGTRNIATCIIAATFKGHGFPKTVAYYTIKGAVELQSELYPHNQGKYPKKEIWRTIEQVYGPQWNKGTFAEDNFPKELVKFFEDNNIPRFDEADKNEKLLKINDAFDDFKDYAENIDENTIKSGIPSLDNKMRIQTGHLIGVLASPGAGKTSMALTLLSNTSKQGIDSVFFSYDMYKNILVQKLIQRETGLESEEVFQTYVDNDVEKIKGFKELLNDGFKNVNFCFKSAQSLLQLKNSIDQVERNLGRMVKFVVVDYLELVVAESSDPTQASMQVIQGLREIANEGRAVVVLLQPNKMSSAPNEPMTSYNAAKGSSSIAQAVTTMITCHRPGMSSQTPQFDKYFSINIVKSRMGKLFALDFSWEGLRGQIAELDDKGKAELKGLREMLKAEDEDDL